MANKQSIRNNLIDKLQYKSFEQLHSHHKESHKDIFSKINKKNAEYFSVILIQRSSQNVITKFCKKVAFTEMSLIEAAAKRKAFDKYNGFLWVYRKIKRRFPTLSAEEQQVEIDYYIKCLVESLYPEMLESYARGWAVCRSSEENSVFTGKSYQEISTEYHDELAKYLQSLFIPICEHRHLLPSNIPYPLSTGIGIAITSQYYFMRDMDIDQNRIFYAVGNYTGSWVRETHGLYGHLFAEIQTKIKPVPTFVVRADGQDKFKVLRKSDNLILSNHGDLTGNYNISSNLSRKILKNIEIY